jgi:tyrosyl-tRNA synthetase
MSFQYDLQTLKEAILFNTVEVLPSSSQQLDQEIHTLIDNANQTGEPIRHYIGFEISGQIHIGTGIMSALKIKKLQETGVKCSLFLADYHTYLNGKLDGKMETIRRVATDYFAPIMLKCCEVVGCEVEEIDLILAENEYEKKVNQHSYFSFYLKIAKELTLSRVLKSVSVTGKTAGDGVDFGTLCYPVMQVADAFFMQTHLVHAGLDQRKCHVLMRETAPKLDENCSLKIGKKPVKPIAIHHSLLLGLGVEIKKVEEILSSENKDDKDNLKEGLKMSKSKPDSAIWVHDSFEEILRKLKKAYCPMVPWNEDNGPEILKRKKELELQRKLNENIMSPDDIYFNQIFLKNQLEEEFPIFKDFIKFQKEYNPILNWSKKMIFPAGRILEIKRLKEDGGDKIYTDYESLEYDYVFEKLQPKYLKIAVARCLADWFLPIWEFVQSKPEILELVKNARK